MATALDLIPEPAPERGTSRSAVGEAARNAVRRGLLARAAERRRLRLETIPATWPMTRHLVRRVGAQLVREGLLEPGLNDTLCITEAGRRVLAAMSGR